MLIKFSHLIHLTLPFLHLLPAIAFLLFFSLPVRVTDNTALK